MNFYIGNSIEEISPNDRNVELSDELLEYLIYHKGDIKLDWIMLQDIDPYDDAVINNSDLDVWKDMCSLIIDGNLLNDYDDRNEVSSIKELRDLINEAIILRKSIVLIGD